jgi:hypothetical protein
VYEEQQERNNCRGPSSHKPTKITDSTLDLVEKLLSMLLETKVKITLLGTGDPTVINLRIPKEKEALLNLLALKYGIEVTYLFDQIQLVFPLSNP